MTTNLTRQSCIAEALNTAHTLVSQLDKMAIKRAQEAFIGLSNPALNGNSPPGSTNKKFVILIAQSNPLTHPWTPLTVEQLCKNFKGNGIKLSVISPHKLPELRKIFENAGGEMALQKNYATEIQHMVGSSSYGRKFIIW